MDLVASFSATADDRAARGRCRAVFVGGDSLVLGDRLPFFRGAVAGLVGAGASPLRRRRSLRLRPASSSAAPAFLLLALAYVLSSFVVRASANGRAWRRRSSSL
jgi:hypothetical protein